MKDIKTDSKNLPKSGHSPKIEKDKRKAKELEVIKESLTKSEMEVVTTVFRSYETGLRRASILPKVKYI